MRNEHARHHWTLVQHHLSFEHQILWTIFLGSGIGTFLPHRRQQLKSEAKRHLDELVTSFPAHWLGKPSLSFLRAQMTDKKQEDAHIALGALRRAGLSE